MEGSAYLLHSGCMYGCHTLYSASKSIGRSYRARNVPVSRRQSGIIARASATTAQASTSDGVVMRPLVRRADPGPSKPIIAARRGYYTDSANGNKSQPLLEVEEDRLKSSLDASTSGNTPDFVSFKASNGVSKSTGMKYTLPDHGNSKATNGIVVAKAPVMPVVQMAALEVVEVVKGQGYSSDIEDVGSSRLMRVPDADFRWSKDNYSTTRRTVDTWTFFTVFRTRLWLLDQKWSYPGGFTEEKKKLRSRELAKYLVASLLELGPTFIKIGQLSSTRSDLLPAEFTEELAYLQDRVPGFPKEKVYQIIERELGRPVGELFASFDDFPIAAASLGQVHRAQLPSGETVVVKVQRPGLKKLFDIDLQNLKLLAEQLDKGDEDRDFVGIYQECADVLYQEIDYIQEGRSADRFRRNFAGTPWVRVPRVFWSHSSRRVLTLEYLPGTKITDKEVLLAAGVDVELVARRATESYLIQLLKHGFFHADPHPGNLSVDSQGRLLFYDFGMMGQLVPDVRERLLDVFYGIYQKDANQVIRALIELKVLTPTGDAVAVRRAITYFLDNIARQTQEKETISAIGEDLFAIAVDQPFRFPATFTFVLRAFSTLEGIGKTLNPDYQFAAVAAPYAQELLEAQAAQSRSGFLLDQLQAQATQVGRATAAMPLRVARIDSTLTQIESGDLKLRVRALEVERAARRMSVTQNMTLQLVGAMGLVNLSTTFSLAGMQGPATTCMVLAGGLGVFLYQGYRRIKRLDKFEKDLKR